MKRIHYIILSCLSLSAISAIAVLEFPQTEISNGIVRARLYLPDTVNGYYRGTRFDWAGVMPELEYKGHSYCGQWFGTYSPTLHEAVMGPVESFSPLGYEEASPGKGFVQIGVGVLAREDGTPYAPFHTYRILNGGDWKIKKRPSKVEFIHTLRDTAASYVYTKTVELIKGKAQLVLTHSLKNTGSRPIETSVYDHNLFLLDHQLTGAGAVIIFPFALKEEGKSRGIGDLAVIKDNQLVFQREFSKREQVYTILQGYGSSAKDYDIKIENRKTGAGVRITGDQPLSKLVCWACPTTFTPEPYIQFRINPGESFNWKLTYEFYTCEISK